MDAMSVAEPQLLGLDLSLKVDEAAVATPVDLHDASPPRFSADPTSKRIRLVEAQPQFRLIKEEAGLRWRETPPSLK